MLFIDRSNVINNIPTLFVAHNVIHNIIHISTSFIIAGKGHLKTAQNYNMNNIMDDKRSFPLHE